LGRLDKLLLVAPEIPTQVIELMAARRARQHHLLWHEVRNMWLSYDDATRTQLVDLGWEPPRPARQGPPTRAVILDNHSGEDFLFMHRQMIAAVNEVLTEVGDPDYPRIEAWPQVPPPGDPDYPVPPAWKTGNPALDGFLQETKSDDFFEQLRLWEGQYRDADRLRGWSLGELGARIEFTIHNRMHMRWCAESPIRPDVDSSQPDTIPTRWDDPSYRWLGDTYSSHVNSTFWKLHGWVDERIDDWMQAHDLTGSVPWKTGSPWVGDMPHGHEPNDPHLLMAPERAQREGLGREELHRHTHKMDLATSAVLGSGRFHHFYDPVAFPD
jgi:hypothetical protein